MTIIALPMVPCVLLALAIGLGCSRAGQPSPPSAVETGVETGVPLAASSGRDAAAPVKPPLSKRVSGAFGFVVSPAAPSPWPAIVYLHGMGASPEDSCAHFEPAATAVHAILLCPRGNMPKSAGGAWGGMLPEKRVHLDQAWTAIEAPSGEHTLIGFSIGAAFALQLARAEPNKWTGLILMSQPTVADAEMLRAAGVRRVVLGAGELDGSYAHLRALAVSLEKAHYPVRFVSLGKTGHHFAPIGTMEALMVDAIQWVRSSSAGEK